MHTLSHRRAQVGLQARGSVESLREGEAGAEPAGGRRGAGTATEGALQAMASPSVYPKEQGGRPRKGFK